MFLFVVHPFDVGDRLLIDGELHTVAKIKLSTTVFEQGDGTKVWFPNDKLALGPILNQTRAARARESFEFAMDLDTPVTTFEAVQNAAEKYIQLRHKDFDGRCTCVTTATLDPLKLRLAISVTYSFNRAETQRLGEVRHGLILEVTQALVERKAAYTDSQVVLPLRKAQKDRQREAQAEEGEEEEEPAGP
ncbi:MAG: mechanosensitive ion channel [Propionibacteriaceae bacterium]|nr:MAG: mechanosensitive ion channel [Propionibacteriaceae bacterium]